MAIRVEYKIKRATGKEFVDLLNQITIELQAAIQYQSSYTVAVGLSFLFLTPSRLRYSNRDRGSNVAGVSHIEGFCKKQAALDAYVSFKTDAKGQSFYVFRQNLQAIKMGCFN